MMDRLRHSRRDWRRAQAKARADLALPSNRCQHCDSPRVGNVLVKGAPLCGDCAYAIWLTGRDPIIESASPGLFSHGAQREAERFAPCGLGLNGLSCSYTRGHASALHSWEVADRLPRYRAVGEAT